MDQVDTIAAIATPLGIGGIGVVRISGPAALSIAQRVFVRSSGAPCTSLKSHRVYHGFVVNGAGARVAEPGEFTKRAFLNGRLDLTQAEAVIDVINARTLASHRAALQQLEGALSRRLHALREQLVQVSVYLEAGIDFPEEDLELVPIAELVDRLAAIGTRLTRLLETFRRGRVVREGL